MNDLGFYENKFSFNINYIKNLEDENNIQDKTEETEKRDFIFKVK